MWGALSRHEREEGSEGGGGGGGGISCIPTALPPSCPEYHCVVSEYSNLIWSIASDRWISILLSRYGASAPLAGVAAAEAAAAAAWAVVLAVVGNTSVPAGWVRLLLTSLSTADGSGGPGLAARTDSAQVYVRTSVEPDAVRDGPEEVRLGLELELDADREGTVRLLVLTETVPTGVMTVFRRDAIVVFYSFVIVFGASGWEGGRG